MRLLLLLASPLLAAAELPPIVAHSWGSPKNVPKS
jgi:hypothetical protein